MLAAGSIPVPRSDRDKRAVVYGSIAILMVLGGAYGAFPAWGSERKSPAIHRVYPRRVRALAVAATIGFYESHKFWAQKYPVGFV